MKTIFFQNEAIQKIRQELAQAGASRELLRRVAQEVLVLSDRFVVDIPNDAVNDFVKKFPSFSHLFAEFLREEDKEASRIAIEELRKILNS